MSASEIAQRNCSSRRLRAPLCRPFGKNFASLLALADYLLNRDYYVAPFSIRLMPSHNRLHLIPAVLFALAAAAVAEPVVVWPIPQPPAGTPVDAFPLPRFNTLYWFQERLNIARRKPVDLVFDGDSITDFWQDRGKAVWQERYGSMNAVDFAIAWDQVQNALWRLDHGQLDGLHPKLAVLLFGCQNVSVNSAEDIAAGVKVAVADYRKLCPDTHLLLLGVFPCAQLPANPLRAKIKQINQLISKLDDGARITFMDIGDKFLQPDGSISKDVMSDFIHPTEEGYRIWADAIQPVVDQYCPKSTASVVRTPAGAPVSTGADVVTWPYPTPAPGAVVTTFPVPDIADWFDRFDQNRAKLKDGPCDLVFDGDSITDNWQRPGHEVWVQRYGAIKALDNGIGGDRTQQVLWRVQHGDLEGQNPKLIVLMIGTNNSGSPANVCAGIKLILNEYEMRCPNAHILLLGIFPRGHEANDPSRDRIKNINRILATYDDGKKVTFMDIGPKFLQPDGTISAEIMPDFLHPSAKGYVIWADAIQPVVDQYFPKTTAAK